jgi:hypothetical protein
MNRKQGVKDLMKAKRYSVIHLTEALQVKNVPGNWDTYQNVYNFINGRTPRDSYAFIVLADLLDVDLRTILLRYSTVEEGMTKAVVELNDANYEYGW